MCGGDIANCRSDRNQTASDLQLQPVIWSAVMPSRDFVLAFAA